jgi:hypothetical protein
MEKTITLEITESQAKKIESLLDEFSDTVKRSAQRQLNAEDVSNFKTETQILLSQAKEELKKIREFNSNRSKMIWEQ